ncbi:IS66 family element, transposase [mine drainage metagenome]|uniref:IS66 family element, transposase n=1 Tax=mine drainage metagenome TaxID=410659 RepID=T1D499_9ZZZZ
MDTVPHEKEPASADRKSTPFAQQWVTLSQQEYIQLVWDARYWKTAHRRALRETALQNELEAAQARIRDLQKRLFGRQSEHSARGHKGLTPDRSSSRSRGQQPGTHGHGRTRQAHLPAHEETIAIDSPRCPHCGLGYADFPGTEDSEVLEIEVQAYRRVIHRRRYRKVCSCVGVPGLITASPPPRLIPRGKFGISVWVSVLLDKFLYGRPSHRWVQDLSDQGLTMSPGTLAGGLRTITPLFTPLDQALTYKLRSESHWHADETRWMVFVDIEGKVGHRWYWWVFQSPSVIHSVLDPTRSADVPITELAAAQGGIVSCDRYSAYKKFVRLHPAFVLAFCWAHQRRDFLELANRYPDLLPWAMTWVDAIAELYHRNGLRLQADPGSAEYAAHHARLQQAVHDWTLRRDEALANRKLAVPAAQVLHRMQNHWAGLTVFVDHPEVPMDNNAAERDMRLAVVGRKNFTGSGSAWSGQLTATMYRLLMTVKLWGINPRTWLSTYLQACAENGNQPPSDLGAFLPWSMEAVQRARMKQEHGEPETARPKGIDSS